MNQSGLKQIESDVNEALHYLETFLGLEINELKRQIENIKRINVQILAQHIQAQIELGLHKDKNEIIQDIRSIIRD